jgi:hypothetical protein
MRYSHHDARKALDDDELASLARLAHQKASAAYRQAAEARKLTAQLCVELEVESDTWEETDDKHRDSHAA